MHIIQSPFASSQHIYACLAAMSVCLLMGVQNDALIDLLPTIPLNLVENVVTKTIDAKNFVFTTLNSYDGISHILSEYLSRS